MKINWRELFIHLGLFVILTLGIILAYGFVHETAHFVACKGLGLTANITINLMQNPPLYLTTCPEANQLNPNGLFIIRSAPYFLSAIIMLLLLIFFKPLKFWHLSLPTGILLSDWMNLTNLMAFFFSRTIDFRNDFAQVAFLHNNSLNFFMSLFLGLTTVFYFWIIKRYHNFQIRKEVKK